MAAATADVHIFRKDASTIQHPVAASSTIYAGSFVCADADGYAIAAADTTAYKFLGIAEDQVDNSAGADAAKNVLIHTGKGAGEMFKCTVTGVAITDVGRPVFITDSQTLSCINGQVPVGHVVKYDSSNTAWVVFDKVEFGYYDIPIDLTGPSADADVGAGITATFNHLIVGTSYHVLVVSTGVSAEQVIQFEIGTTDITGGGISLTLANTDALGDVVDGAAVTAANYLVDGAVLQLDSDWTTNFTAGTGIVKVRYAY
jgi:hypothetical protein